MAEADCVGAGLDVDVVHLTVGVRQAPVEVVDEGQAVHAAVQSRDIASDFAVVGLVPLNAEAAVVGDRRGHAGGPHRARLGRIDGAGRVPAGEGVGGDRGPDVGGQEGVVQTGREGGRAVDEARGGRRAGSGRQREVTDVDVPEGLLADVEGVFGRVLGLDRQTNVVGDVKVHADLEALRLLEGEARALVEGRLVGRLAVAADVPRTVGTGLADALAEVGQTRRRAGVPVGVGRIDAVAVTRSRRAGAVGKRHVRIVVRAGPLHVGQGGRTPGRAVQAAGPEELADVIDAVGGRAEDGVGRIGVDAEADTAVLEPVDVFGEHFLGPLIFAVGVDVQPVVEEVRAGQHRDAASVGGTVLDQLAEVGVDLEPFEILAQDVVDDAGDGVRAVNRRTAAGDDLDVLDQQAGNDGGVDAEAARGRTDVTATVNEGQGAARTQRAQVGELEAAVVQVVAGRVRRHQRVRQRRDGGQVVDHRGETGLQQLLALDLDQRGGRVGRVATDTRTGDDDFIDLGGFRVLARVLGEGRGREGHDAREDGGSEKVLALQKHVSGPKQNKVCNDARLLPQAASPTITLAATAAATRLCVPIMTIHGPVCYNPDTLSPRKGNAGGAVRAPRRGRQRFSFSHTASWPTTPRRPARGASAAPICLAISLRAETDSRGP